MAAGKHREALPALEVAKANGTEVVRRKSQRDSLDELSSRHSDPDQVHIVVQRQPPGEVEVLSLSVAS